HDKQGRDGNRHNLENSSPSPAAAEPTQNPGRQGVAATGAGTDTTHYLSCCATSQSYAAGQVPVQVPLPGLVAPCDAKLAGEPLRKRATHGELLFQFPPTPLDISNGRRWGCCHGIAWVSSAPEPGAGSVQFLPQATLGNTTPTPQEGPGNGLWLGRQHFGPSTLGGWCAGSVLRELPAGTPDFASRQSAPSPSGRSGGGRALGPDRLDAAKRPAARPAPVQSADVSVRANTRTILLAPRLAHQISNRGGDPATGRWGGFSVES
ncbi:hypothetical protein N5P37_003853, partial [Trichoderma harzianum]